MNNITSAEFISDLLSSAEQLNLNNDMQEALCKARYETMCKYSPVQEYKCQVGIYFMPQSQMETIYVDTCLQCEIQDLIRKHGVHTVGSCCGHGVMQGYIQVSEHSVKKMLSLGYKQLPINKNRNGVNCFKPKTILYIENNREDCNEKK